jgi:ketosteroid isomerase-like protein
MSTADFDQFFERYHVAQGEFLKGNPEPVKELWSHRDDVSLANPYGPPVRGWEQVAQVIEHAASLRRDGELVGIEIIAQVVTADLRYMVGIERATAKVGSSEDVTPYALRATNSYRREEGGWRMLHRHADPITTTQPAESVLRQ